MNYSIYRFTLDIHRTKSQVSIPVMFRDTGIKFYISLTDGGKPYFIEDGCRAVFSAKKHDGKTLFNDCIIEDNTRIRYDFTEQTTNCEGMMNCEIRLYGTDGELITTPAFVVVVDNRVVYDSEVLDSYSEATTLDSIITTESSRVDAENTRVDSEAGRIAAENARADAEGVRVDAENARVAAETERATEERERDKAEEKRIANEAERIAAFASMLGMWVAYSAHADGTDYTYTWSEGQRYIGICNGKTQPTDKTGFVWAKFVDTGVYVGSGDMPSWCDLQIDPDGYVTEIVQTPGQSTSDMMSQKAVSDNFANALKGSASGAAVVLDDVSPIEHGMNVRAKSKNLIDPAKFASASGDSSASFETKREGDVFISNITSATNYFNHNKKNPFKAGTYTLSVIPVSSNMYFAINIYKANAPAELLFDEPYVYEKQSNAVYITFTAEEDFLVCLGGYKTEQNNGNVGDGIFYYKMQLVEGEIETAYTHYVDLSNVLVTRSGKNLASKNVIELTGGVQNEVIFKGNVTGDFIFSYKKDITATTHPSATLFQFTVDGNNVNVNNNNTTIAFSGTLTKAECVNWSLSTGNVSDIQLEFGKEVTSFEEYKGIESAMPNADGSVNGITSVYPTTVLYTDTAGVNIEVGYNKDATKVVNELATRIAALEDAALN